MEPDHWQLYRDMLKSRLFEEAVLKLWDLGKISGEMHLAIGEEAIAAGVVDHMQEGDALSLDHRGTPQLLMRGIAPLDLLLEFFGHPGGLCGGMGGHMHLFSKDHLAATSGIVGASCPAAVGFALAGRHLRPGKVSVAFFGEGAVNQGMVMESFNLAAIWKLPVIFVCKDNKRAITTPSESVTAGKLTERVKSFDIPSRAVDGSDLDAVWHCAAKAFYRARRGKGPSYIHATCFRPEGHFLGDPLIKIASQPVKEMTPLTGPLLRSVTRRKGASLKDRSASMLGVMATIGKTMKDRLGSKGDPLKKARKKLRGDRDALERVENQVEQEVRKVVEEAMRTANIYLEGDNP